MTLWGGRFSGKLHPDAWALNASIGFDRRLAAQDVRGSIAWAWALHRAGVVDEQETDEIVQGLQLIGEEFARGDFAFQEADEDIHTAVERRLGELTGPAAGKLHTGRSRNDQVATDFRLWVMEALDELDALVKGLQAVLVRRAEEHQDVILPGYTHLQRAQPVLLGHWWLSHFWPLQRDRERLAQLRPRAAVLPLGSAALAGTAFPIDRAALAAELGFAAPAPNSLDAVSDRDFAAELLFIAALMGVHLSRLAEPVILFTTAEFGFFELSDAFATGSSLMPQKKNPDVFELARGKAGSLIGSLAGLLATLKGLPSAYDKDLQEDKLPVFAAFDALSALLPAVAGALDTLKVHPERMRLAVDAGMQATDLADYLVVQGVPFRQAHSLTGKAVQLAASRGIPLDALSVEDFQAISPLLGPEVYALFDPARSIARKRATGGTAPEALKEQFAQARELLGQS